MENKFVQFTVDVSAKQRPDTELRYRAYVNDELFTERNWIWTNTYLEEMHQILAPTGTYPIRYETVDRESGRIRANNFRVIEGPAVIVEDNNGSLFYAGLKHGMEVSGGTIVTGAAMGDLSGYTLVLTGQEPVPANFLGATLVAAGFTVVSGS
jgi:hypothetical protein